MLFTIVCRGINQGGKPDIELCGERDSILQAYHILASHYEADDSWVRIEVHDGAGNRYNPLAGLICVQCGTWGYVEIKNKETKWVTG